MAPQTLIILAITLLVFVLGGNASKTCRVSSDCPQCHFGARFCSGGHCGCTDVDDVSNNIAQQEQKTCRVRSDCPRCQVGLRTCSDGHCTCSDLDDVSNNLAEQEQQTCRVSSDCPRCKFGIRLCSGGNCSCSDRDDDTKNIAQQKQKINGCKNNRDCERLCPNPKCRSSCSHNLCICSC